MKLIFLDVNGVLNNTDLKKKLKRKGVIDIDKHYDNKSMDYLKELVNVSGAKIVLTSEIRKDHNSDNYKFLKNRLTSKGISIYDELPTDVSTIDKGINDYIDRLEMIGALIDAYVILDDENQELFSSDSNFIHVRSGIENKDGLTHKHLMEAIKILMGKNYIHVEGGQI